MLHITTYNIQIKHFVKFKNYFHYLSISVISHYFVDSNFICHRLRF